MVRKKLLQPMMRYTCVNTFQFNIKTTIVSYAISLLLTVVAIIVSSYSNSLAQMEV